ncbi:hypothetical protein [Staphylococcus nepalensis]|jgi:hypothetical protein|uniref:hypothetical protein n=1 Tax=Staphylococcus nepalensis TaxID=214473 RepID=UPI0030192463
MSGKDLNSEVEVMINVLMNSQSIVPAYISLMYYRYETEQYMSMKELIAMAEIEDVINRLVKQ